jgi:hypothetical protein
MRASQKWVELIAEAILPLLGFFVWGWNLYFISLFYLLDYFISEVFIYVESYKTSQFHKKGIQQIYLSGVASFFLMCGLMVLTHLTILNIFKHIDFWNEFKLFLAYEDMGIAQGYIILPLLILTSYQKYKLFFLFPKVYEKTTVKSIWVKRIRLHFFVFGFVAFGFCLSLLTALNATFYLYAIIVSTSLYKLITSTR